MLHIMVGSLDIRKLLDKLKVNMSALEKNRQPGSPVASQN